MKSWEKWLLIRFGYNYLVNKHTKEIHDMSNEKKNCSIELMKFKNMQFRKKESLPFSIAAGNNGCIHCMPKENTD